MAFGSNVPEGPMINSDPCSQQKYTPVMDIFTLKYMRTGNNYLFTDADRLFLLSGRCEDLADADRLAELSGHPAVVK